MDSTWKRWAFRVIVVLLLLILFPVIASSVALLVGPLNGMRFPGNLLLSLIDNSDGPTPILQGAFTLIFGVIGISTLWGEGARYAVFLIVLCLIGIVLTWIMWSHLSDRESAADLWQEANRSLNGTTFAPAMHAYMKALFIALVVDLLGIFGLKGIEQWKG